MTDLLSQMKGGESTILEFKESLPEDNIGWLKTVVAFANGRGGRLVVGVDDRGEIFGVTKEELEQLCQSIDDSISDSIVPQISRDVYVQSLEGESVVVVEVYPGSGRPYYIKRLGVKEGTFVRRGASTRLVDDATLDELRLQGKRSTFDSLENLDIAVTRERTDCIIRKVGELYGAEIDETDLRNCGIIRVKDGQDIPTNAYALLQGS